MTSVTQVTLTCDVCGNAKDVKTWTFGLDGKAYEIDLCRKDGNALGRITARYMAKARKVTAKPGQRQHDARPRGAKARAASSKKAARATRLPPRNAEGAGDAVLSEVLQDTRALRQAMEGVSVASVAREPADEPDSVHVAFLVAVDQQHEVERVVEDLAREWEGRIDVQLLGPMAAYDFTGTAQPES